MEEKQEQEQEEEVELIKVSRRTKRQKKACSGSDMQNYLTGILAPVWTSSTEHVLRDQVSIIILLSTHVLGEEVHLSFSQVLGLVPQTCGEPEELIKVICGL